MTRRIAVVVPAKDEQDSIAQCLTTLSAAVVQARAVGVQADVLVVLDDCRDATAEVVASFADVATVTSTACCVGTARAIGAAAAIDRWGPAEHLWLASTDADCHVAPHWLTDMAEHAAAADLVLGTVRPHGLAGLHGSELAAAWHDAHVLTDGHPHVHGANFGISAECYRSLGGWAPLPVHEDRDLVERALAHGARIVRTDAAPVLTSARLQGRTPDGFAGYLRALSDSLPAVS